MPRRGGDKRTLFELCAGGRADYAPMVVQPCKHPQTQVKTWIPIYDGDYEHAEDAEVNLCVYFEK